MRPMKGNPKNSFEVTHVYSKHKKNGDLIVNAIATIAVSGHTRKEERKAITNFLQVVDISDLIDIIIISTWPINHRHWINFYLFGRLKYIHQ